jgi:hypothetical protein
MSSESNKIKVGDILRVQEYKLGSLPVARIREMTGYGIVYNHGDPAQHSTYSVFLQLPFQVSTRQCLSVADALSILKSIVGDTFYSLKKSETVNSSVREIPI